MSEKRSTLKLSDIAGWIGMISFLLAYILVSRETIIAKSATYQLLNLFGAIGVGINVYTKKVWPVLTLECIWGLIAIYVLVVGLR